MIALPSCPFASTLWWNSMSMLYKLEKARCAQRGNNQASCLSQHHQQYCVISNARYLFKNHDKILSLQRAIHHSCFLSGTHTFFPQLHIPSINLCLLNFCPVSFHTKKGVPTLASQITTPFWLKSIQCHFQIVGSNTLWVSALKY